jgi:hypothetical protein
VLKETLETRWRNNTQRERCGDGGTNTKATLQIVEDCQKLFVWVSFCCIPHAQGAGASDLSPQAS